MFRGMFYASGRAMVDAIPTLGQILREFAPSYLANVTPVMSQFLADQHRAMEQALGHVEDRNTRAIVAAMLLSGATVGPYAKT